MKIPRATQDTANVLLSESYRDMSLLKENMPIYAALGMFLPNFSLGKVVMRLLSREFSVVRSHSELSSCPGASY